MAEVPVTVQEFKSDRANAISNWKGNVIRNRNFLLQVQTVQSNAVGLVKRVHSRLFPQSSRNYGRMVRTSWHILLV
jgi:subtilase family serine protease